MIVYAALLLSTASCNTTLGSAREAYEQARYADAIALYRSVDSDALGASQRARWQLYAGLSELSLGNLQSAVAYLSQARCALQYDDRVLDDVERGRLAAAWMSIGRMPSESLYDTPERPTRCP